MTSYTNFKLFYGYSYENEIDFEYYVTKFNGGLPSKKVSSSDKMSNGASLSKTNFFGGYNCKLNILFLGWKLYLREALLKMIAMPSYIPIKLQRTQIINGIEIIDELYNCQIKLNDGEKFTAGFATSEIDINILSEDAYFQNVKLTTHVLALEDIMTFVNAGLGVFPIFQFELSEDSSSIDLKFAEGLGFRIDYEFNYGDVVVLITTSSSIEVYINGILFQNILSANSAPFEILPDLNTIYYSGGNGTLIITYSETRL